MIAVKGSKNQNYAVLGLGRSGLVAANALVAGGASVQCWDDTETVRTNAQDQGLTIVDLLRDARWDEIDCLVVSPGIAHHFPNPHPIIAKAVSAGVPIDNDVGLFFRSVADDSWFEFDQQPKIVAVTGSNGKSTTSALIHHVLTNIGRTSQLAGNIGRGVLDIDPPTDGSVVVLELSSYQTEIARSLTPDVAVFTNLSPDHLDRHCGYGGYFAAKRRLFAEGGPDRLVVGVDEYAGQFLAQQMAQTQQDDRVIRVSSGQKLDKFGWSVFVRKGFLAEFRKGKQVASIDLRSIAGLPGAHNHQNAAAAYSVLRTLGLAPRIIEKGFQTFSGLAHRSQRVAEQNGINYVNDSKATNIDSAIKALRAFSNVRWICGGLQKEGGLDQLNEATQSVKRAYVIGREAEKFAMQLKCDSVVCTTMQQAVELAHEQSEKGDCILLAPAAASFDQYDNFEQRGDDFIACVHTVLGNAPSSK